MSDLVGIPNCWFCHAQAHIVNDNELVSVFLSYYFAIVNDGVHFCYTCLRIGDY